MHNEFSPQDVAALGVRLEGINKKLDHLTNVIEGTNGTGLKERVRDVNEALFGGTARVPQEKSIAAVVEATNAEVRQFKTVIRVFQWIAGFVGIGTLSGLLYIIALVRG